MRTWSRYRLLSYFYSLRIVQLFVLFFVLRSRVRRGIFRSNLRQRMLLLYAGIKMKAFAFWSVFRRRNRRSWRLLVVRTSAVRIRSFIHSSSLRSTNVRQHDFFFLWTLIQDGKSYFLLQLFSEIDVSTCMTTIYIFCFLKVLILWIIMKKAEFKPIYGHSWIFLPTTSLQVKISRHFFIVSSSEDKKPQSVSRTSRARL